VTDTAHGAVYRISKDAGVSEVGVIAHPERLRDVVVLRTPIRP
jgi:hypothetical protein